MCIPHEEHTEAEAEPSPRGSQGHKRTSPTNSDSKQPTRLATQKYVVRPVSSQNSQNVPQTGRLKNFIPAWERITLDPWVLQVVQGYKIELITNPVQQF